MAKTMPKFNAPVPGQSLTAEPGSRPWENPPKYTTVEDTIEFYIESLSEPKKLSRILDKIEEGVPLGVLTSTLTGLGVSKGLHTVDVSMIVSPVLIEFFKAVAEQEEIEYLIGDEDEDSKVSREEAVILAKKVEASDPSVPQEEDETAVPNFGDDEEEKAPEEKKGLMARDSEPSETASAEEEV